MKPTANGMVGWTFSLNHTETISQIGWYDYGRDGLLVIMKSVCGRAWREVICGRLFLPDQIRHNCWGA